jgi:hypothetical protein
MAAWRCINDFSAPSSANVRTGLEMNIRDGSFELRQALINMVQQSPFCGRASEDANAHLQYFMDSCNTFTIHEEVNMLTAKIGLLMKTLENPGLNHLKMVDARVTCEECREIGHIGINYPTVSQDVNFIGNSNNGFCPNQGFNAGLNKPSFCLTTASRVVMGRISAEMSPLSKISSGVGKDKKPSIAENFSVKFSRRVKNATPTATSSPVAPVT